jgi:hypothetical protein
MSTRIFSAAMSFSSEGMGLHEQSLSPKRSTWKGGSATGGEIFPLACR